MVFLIIGKWMKTWQIGLQIDNKVAMDNEHWNEKSRNTRIFLNG